MIKTLRPYQHEALQTLRQRLKQVTHPLLVNASVGAGKSLILSELLLDMERANYRALCLTMNSTLIQQNAETYRLQGGNPGIYCASLNSKDTKQYVIFASPHSIVTNLPEIDFNLIIVDECHGINAKDPNTMYMRILNHYGFKAQEARRSFRIVGLTGTPYRGKGHSIVGPDQLFKEQVCNISSTWLIKEGYLVKPYFGITHVDAIDFSDCHVENTGKFKHKDLEKAINKNERLTGEIMKEVAAVVHSSGNGAFIFAATIKHCYECARSLPEGEWAIIIGDTPHEERRDILEKARNGTIRFLISVSCLNVGVDVPSFDVAAWLRPTESLILYTQGIGRVLRLHPGKSRATVLDYAGNLLRHGDIDNPIINEALQPNEENEKEYVIPCYDCGTNNTIHARRCIGVISDKRCDHYFQFKACHACAIPNDTTSRYCRGCDAELIDPNAKLTRLKNTHEFEVIQAGYRVSQIQSSGLPIINIDYKTNEGIVFEVYYLNTEKSRNIAYAKFIRLHAQKPSDWYMKMMNYEAMKYLVYETDLKTPNKITCSQDHYGRYHVIKKSFNTVEALN